MQENSDDDDNVDDDDNAGENEESDDEKYDTPLDQRKAEKANKKDKDWTSNSGE